jgi:hypothetical protein
MRGRAVAVAVAVVAASGGAACGGPAAEAPTEPPAGAGAAVRAPAETAGADAALRERISAEADSTDGLLRRVRNLTGAERAALRTDVNEAQLARARALGVRAGDRYREEAARGRLVRLADSTRYWVVRDLDFSVPYVTPGAEAMLAEAGRRFHATLDSLGLPLYRLDVTSVLRTAENQAALRRSNANAADGVSAHEFGTTLDVAYRRFHPPAGDPPFAAAGGWTPEAALPRDSLLAATADRRAAELQALLGRVLLEMRREGKVMVMMERRQTVYHLTVARRFPGARRVPPV